MFYSATFWYGNFYFFIRFIVEINLQIQLQRLRIKVYKNNRKIDEEKKDYQVKYRLSFNFVSLNPTVNWEASSHSLFFWWNLELYRILRLNSCMFDWIYQPFKVFVRYATRKLNSMPKKLERWLTERARARYAKSCEVNRRVKAMLYLRFESR